jgi:cholesterol transport system auxiliary component
MNALRTARLIASPPARSLVGVGLAGLVVFSLFGCGTGAPSANDPPAHSGTPGANDPPWLTSRDTLPPPDPDRIDYDAQKHTLTLYDLPGRERWMVRLPDEARGRTVGPQHRLPEGVDTAQTLVYYVRLGEKPSAPVTVAAIEACRAGPTSFARKD